jgi:predicted nucleotidyltransferase
VVLVGASQVVVEHRGDGNYIGGNMHLKDFVNRVNATYENRLKSVVLFGSAASEDFSKKYSDYNTIIVLKSVTPGDLEKSAKLVRSWMKAGNPAPLFFDTDHIATSADVFPIEFFDIKANRKILYGDDPFANVNIETTNLRHQCEYELKGKILQLYSRYVQIANKDKEISRLMMESLSTFLSIFKGVVRLLGHEPEVKKRALVEQLAALINFNPNIFMELLDIRDGNNLLPRKNVTTKFEEYLMELKAVTEFVDKFET